MVKHRRSNFHDIKLYTVGSEYLQLLIYAGIMPPPHLLCLSNAASPLALTLLGLISNSNQVSLPTSPLTHHHPDDTNATVIDSNLLLPGLPLPCIY